MSHCGFWLQKVKDADVWLAKLDVVIAKNRIELLKCRRDALLLKRQLLELAAKARKICEELEREVYESAC